MSEKINFPTKLEEKLSFFDRLRKLMKRTSVTVDSKGKVSYISYPPRNGFTKDQKKNISTIEVNDVLILGDDRDRSLLELENLKTLVLGRGVIGVAEGAVPTTGLEELVVSDQAKQIPLGAISRSSIRRVRGNGFDISTDSKAPTNIFFDLDERIHFMQGERLSLGQLDWMDGHGKDAAKESEDTMYFLSESLIKNSSQNKNDNSIYVYSETLGSERASSIHAVADKFPMPYSRDEKIDDDKLIGIFVTGVEEVDLSSLAQYPNLKHITIGKDVRRISTTADLQEKNSENEKNPQRVQKNISGKDQIITMMSDSTVMMMPMLKTPVVPVQEKAKVVEKEEKTIDD